MSESEPTTAEGVRIVHASRRHRYELHDGEAVIGFATYRLPDDEHVDFVHTEVDDVYEGQGLASRLIRFALDDVRAAGKRIVPHCPYVAAWVRRHPEYADATDWP